MRRPRRLAPLVLSLLAALFASDVSAHNLGESYIYLQVYRETVTGRFEISFTDLNPALGLAGTDREITRENLDEHVEFLQQYYLEHVTIATPEGELPINYTTHEILEVGEGFILLSFEMGLTSVPELMIFDYSVLFEEEPSHRGFLLVEYNWATGTFGNENTISAVFTPRSRRQEFEPTSTGRWRGFVGVVVLGMEHIWMGFDHVMFLIALLLPSVLRRENGVWQPVDRFGPALINVVKIVTAFTVAHSVTLSLASLGVMDLPGRLVEVIIAASIAIAAAELLVNIFHGRVWLVVFAFGLFHGFGFAGALSEMRILGEYRGLALFGFNLGVEIGQVAIVVVIFPLLFLFRRLWLYRAVGLPVAAVLMIGISSVWVVERAFDVDVPMGELVIPHVQRWLS